MPKPNENTKKLYYIKTSPHQNSTPRLDLFSVVPASKPLLYLNLPISQAAHLGLICSV